MPVPLQPFTHSRQTPALASAALPQRVGEALQDVLALAVECVAGPLERVLEDLELELHRAAQHTDDAARHAQHLARARVLQRDRHRVAPRFIDRLEGELAALRTRPTRAAQAPAPAASSFGVELRLLEDDEAQDDGLLRAPTMRYEARAGLALQLLGQRFGVLGARPALDAAELPVGPLRLTLLAIEACAPLEFDAELRRRFVALFEQRVLTRYEELADALNEALVRRGVLPSMTYVPIRMRPRTQAADGVAASTETPAPDVAAVPLDLLRSLLARRRAAIDRLRTPQAPRAPEHADAWRAAKLPGFGDVDAASRSAPAPAADADLLELVELWFARLMREVRADSASAAWLDTLRPAVVRTALGDPHVFDRHDHPLRQLLDAIVDAGAPGSADDELDPALQATLARAVDQLVAVDGTPLAFREANETVQDARRAAERRADVAERRLVEAVRGRERLAEARKRAADAIAALGRERTLPRMVRTLVQQAWADVLTLTALRNGEGGEQWRRQLETTREIIDVAGGAPAPPDLAARIREALVAIGTHEDEAASIAAHLSAGEAADDDRAATRTELVMRLKARARLGADTLPEAPAALALTPAEHARLAALPLGEADAWFEFEAGDMHATPPRRRLVWTGPATNAAVFVNRRGQRAAEVTLDALARELEAGRVRAVTPDPRGGVERAWDAVIAALRGFDTGSEAPHG